MEAPDDLAGMIRLKASGSVEAIAANLVARATR